jgi:acyl carrier protein
MLQTQQRTITVVDFEQWLCGVLGELLDIPPDKVDVATHFDRYGLDSSAAISLTEMIGRYIGKTLEPTLLYEYPSIRALALHLSEAA